MSSKYFDDDDLYDEEQSDHGGEQDTQFVEEDLPDDEYDQLYQQLPIIRQALKNYNDAEIDDEVLKKYLWLNYYEVDSSIAEIKSVYKPKQVLHMISFQPRSVHVGGSSKLAQLAAKRAAAKREKESAGEPNNRAVSILDNLSSSKVPKTHPVTKATRLPDQSSPVPAQISPSGRSTKSSSPVPEEIQLETPEKVPDTVAAPIEPSRPVAIELPLLVMDNSLLVQPETQFTRLLTTATGSKKRKLENTAILNALYTDDTIIVKKITTNFSKPSPDDVVLEAQSNAFSEDLDKKINISSNQTKKVDLKKNSKIDLAKELAKLKPQLSFVIFGHVDSGKSTIVGRLLYDLKIVDSKTLHKLQQESDKIGKGSFALAWIMDQTEEERSRGVTVDIVSTSIEADGARFNIIDSPGHVDYVPQLINGIAQADIGVLLIDCNDFANGFQHVKEQVLISKNLGIDTLIVALNKFDLLNYDSALLDDAIEDLTANLVSIGFAAANLKFVPVSGLIGDNIVKKSANFKWDKTLMDLLHEQVQERQKVGQNIKDEPFVLTMNEILESSSAKELRINGRVNSGYAANGDEFEALPNKAVFKLDHKSLVVKGDFINGLRLKPIGASAPEIALITKGDILTNDLANFQTSQELEVDLNLFELQKPLLVGTSFVLFHNCKQYEAKISKISSIFKKSEDGKSEKETAYKKKHLVSHNHAKAVISLDEQLPYNLEIDKLTRIVIRKDGRVIGCGRIL